MHRFRPLVGDNYQYILAVGGDAMVVDPFDETRCFAELDRLNLKPIGILITHTHWDHINGVQGFVQKADVPVYVHSLGVADLPYARTVVLSDGDNIDFAGSQIGVRHLPGHHPAHVLYQWQGYAVVGDLLFLAGCGNPNFGGDVIQLFESIRKGFQSMNPETRLAWGHDYADKNLAFAVDVDPENEATPVLIEEIARLRASDQELPWRTLAEEMAINPFLRASQRDDFVKLRGQRDHF